MRKILEFCEKGGRNLLNYGSVKIVVNKLKNLLEGLEKWSRGCGFSFQFIFSSLNFYLIKNKNLCFFWA